MLAIFPALMRIFSPELFLLLRLSLFCQRIGAVRLISISAALLGSHHLHHALLDSLIIADIDILNWHGAVIAQSVRQFCENLCCFFGIGVI